MEFYIAGYAGGNVGGTNINVYQRFLDNEVGTLGYIGIVLTTGPQITNEFSISRMAIIRLHKC